MNLTTACARALTSTVLALGAALPARAATPIEFLFTGSGITLPMPCGAGCLDVAAVGVADDVLGTGPGIAGSWGLFSNFNVSLPGGAFTGTWQLTDLGASGNDLAGSFSGVLGPLSPTLGQALRVDYVVTGGGGLFAGATGYGRSTVYGSNADFGYAEAGFFHIDAVPEPGTWALLLAGLGAVAAGVRCRRAA